MNYFLLSVSNRENLELCIKYALGGFTNSINGVWTFLDIKEGDFISFLYGARAFNLYKVEKKIAIKNAHKIGPWPPVTFRMSGRTYYFPFRLFLLPVREFIEPIVRQEFAYVAENLLLRGGYRKTHFQADQTTLQAVSQMGETYKKPILPFINSYEEFEPLFAFEAERFYSPEVFRFKEFILQSLIRHYLERKENLNNLFNNCGLVDFKAEDFEVLGEKALPEGHVDILIKERSPKGYCNKIILEIKLRLLKKSDVDQLKKYMDEMGEECKMGIIIGKDVSRSLINEAKNKGIECFIYYFNQIDLKKSYSFNDLLSSLIILKP